MSRLIKETDEYLLLERYIHDESDEFSDWEIGPNGPKYSEAVQTAEHYAFYEILVRYRIYKNIMDNEGSAKVWILPIDGY